MGSREAGALIWAAGTGKNKRPEDRAEGGRSRPTLELGRRGEVWDIVRHPFQQ